MSAPARSRLPPFFVAVGEDAATRSSLAPARGA
jgi:hypothetical protein